MSFVRIEKPRPKVTLVTLNRPERMNAMSFDVMIPLRDALEGIRNDTFWIGYPSDDQHAKIRARAESQIDQTPPTYLLAENLMTGSKAGADD